MQRLSAELAAGLQALEVASTRADIDRLLAYRALIERWNRAYNLTAVREPAAMLRQHLLDSLAVLPALARRLPPGPARHRLLDVGSGAGLPGVVIATMRPDVDVVCVDAVGKKAGFVRQVAAELGIVNLASLHARVEALKVAPFDIVTARAFSSLADWVRLTGPLLASNGLWMAMKGKTPTAEIAALPASVQVTELTLLQVPGLGAERCLVWLERCL